MDVLPFISILILIFALIIVSEIMKLKREIRKLKRQGKRTVLDIKHLKERTNEK
tara:strand:+ start:502 stop:663 length:162 start_codon:yes stop_codon:yes gene_type:complete